MRRTISVDALEDEPAKEEAGTVLAQQPAGSVMEASVTVPTQGGEAEHQEDVFVTLEHGKLGDGADGKWVEPEEKGLVFGVPGESVRLTRAAIFMHGVWMMTSAPHPEATGEPEEDKAMEDALRERQAWD